MSEALNHLATRVSTDPLFLSCALAQYARSENLDDAGVAAALGCQMTDVVRLKLCRAPRPSPEHFREDIAAVASRFGIDPITLAAAVRRGQSLARLREAQSASTDPGFLLAARDDDRQPPPPPLEGADS